VVVVFITRFPNLTSLTVMFVTDYSVVYVSYSTPLSPQRCQQGSWPIWDKFSDVASHHSSTDSINATKKGSGSPDVHWCF